MDPLDRLLHERPDLAPFDPEREADFRSWRDAKLADYPTRAEALRVEVADPAALAPAERHALLARLRKTNMAVYCGPGGDDPALPRRLAGQLGLTRWDPNYLGDEDGISALTDRAGEAGRYIPYTNRPLQWHTDGYYNPPERRIRAFLLHCVRPAAEGGDNGLLDPELLYLLLREADPGHIRALMRSDVLTIPAGTGSDGRPRPAVTGPVFAVDPGGDLSLRYTARRHHVEWRDDGPTRRARAALEAVLAQADAYGFSLRLEAGMGLVCNNVLHNRAGFRDAADGPPRRLYRARYRERVAGTGLHERGASGAN